MFPAADELAQTGCLILRRLRCDPGTRLDETAGAVGLCSRNFRYAFSYILCGAPEQPLQGVPLKSVLAPLGALGAPGGFLSRAPRLRSRRGSVRLLEISGEVVRTTGAGGDHASMLHVTLLTLRSNLLVAPNAKRNRDPNKHFSISLPGKSGRVGLVSLGEAGWRVPSSCLLFMADTLVLVLTNHTQTWYGWIPLNATFKRRNKT